MVQTAPPEAQAMLNGHFALWFDMDINRSTKAFWFMGILVTCFGISGTLCTFLIFFIMKTLRQNADKFSKTTLKLHRQFTVLLAFQVGSWISKKILENMRLTIPGLNILYNEILDGKISAVKKLLGVIPGTINLKQKNRN
jgi:hypothetical protein